MASAKKIDYAPRMRRTFYALILGCIALVWLGHRMRLAFEKLATGQPGDHVLDMRVFGYSPEEARGYLERLGADGRKRYMRVQVRLELAFILAYAIAGASAGMWISAALHQETWKLAAWIPFAGGLLLVAAAVVDLDEQAAVRKLIKAFPRFDDAAVQRASRVTRLKWLLIGLGLAATLVGVVIFLIARLKGG
ncbi:MAG: hypothetical protein ACRC7G_03625 [Beijerinckiaceae bacterium]